MIRLTRTPLVLLLGLSLVLEPVWFPASSSAAGEPEWTPMWVRGDARVNPGGHELSFVGGQECPGWFCDPRYGGKTLDYTVTPTSITMASHHMDYGDEYHNVAFTATFDEPPWEIPEEGLPEWSEEARLTASISRTGSVTRIPPTTGMVFQYASYGLGLNYSNDKSQTEVDLVSGDDSYEVWLTEIPPPSEGAELKITAQIWNCEACYVEWIYQARMEPWDPIAEQYGLPDLRDWEPPLTDTKEVPDAFMPKATLGEVRGGVFVWRHGTGKWKVAVPNLGIWAGDWIFTKDDGHVEVIFGGASRMRLAPRTQMRMPGTSIKRGILERGAIWVWENLTSNGTGFPVEGGHSISGRKGTEYILEVDKDAGTDTITVREGSVTVWHASDNSIQAEIGAGESAQVTGERIDEADYDWDGLVEVAGELGLFDPASGQWHLRYPDGELSSFYYGVPGDVPLMGDWDCDGTDTVGMFRPSSGFVYLRNSNTFGVADREFFYGIGGDVPLAGDWDGDGCDTLAIYRPSQGRVYVSNRLGTYPADFSFYFGIPGDKPFAGDFDGDGITTVGLYRDTTGFVYFRDVLSTGVADLEFFYGVPSDRIVAGDWDADGDDTVGIFRPPDTAFYLSNANVQGFADQVVTMGESDWVPVTGRFAPTITLR